MAETYDGKPCRKCGGTERYPSKGNRCVGCRKAESEKSKHANRARAKKWREDNHEQYKKQMSVYYSDNKDKCNAQSKAYHEANKERMNAIKKERYWENTETRRAESMRWREDNLEEAKARCRAYKRDNPEVINAINAKRRAAKLNRTPSWLTKEQLDEIRDIYLAAEMFKMYTGETYHVDHVIPLQGEAVSGLHIPENLQLLLAKDNLMKSNKFEGGL